MDFSFWLILAIAAAAMLSTAFDDQASRTRKIATNIGALVAMLAALENAYEQAHMNADRTRFQQEAREKTETLRKIGEANQKLTVENLSLSNRLIEQSNIIQLLGEEAVDVSTGRGSRAEFEVSVHTAVDQSSVMFYLNKIGKNPLRDLHAKLNRATQHSGEGASGHSIYEHHFDTFTGTHDSLSRMVSPQRLTGNSALFFGWLNAMNGQWEQTIKLRRVGERWEWRSIVHSDTPTKGGTKRIRIISDKTSSGFPPNERARPVFPFSAEDVGTAK